MKFRSLTTNEEMIGTESTTPSPTNISPQVDTGQRPVLTMQLLMATKTKQRFVLRVTRVYEQGSIPRVIEGYVRRWKHWAAAHPSPSPEQPAAPQSLSLCPAATRLTAETIPFVEYPGPGWSAT